MSNKINREAKILKDGKLYVRRPSCMEQEGEFVNTRCPHKDSDPWNPLPCCNHHCPAFMEGTVEGPVNAESTPLDNTHHYVDLRCFPAPVRYVVVEDERKSKGVKSNEAITHDCNYS